MDEHADSLPTRLINKLFVTWDVLKEKLTTDEVLPVISLIAAILFVVIGAQCMQLMVGLDDDDQSGKSGIFGSFFGIVKKLCQ